MSRSGLWGIQRGVATILNGLQSGAASRYIVRRSFSSNKGLISYTQIGDLTQEVAANYVRGTRSHLIKPALDLSNPKVLRVATQDISVKADDDYGQIILLSEKGIGVKYGKEGIAPSADVKPEDLLHYGITIPPSSYGILDIKRHVPFSIIPEDSSRSVAIPVFGELEIVPTHEENKRRYSLVSVCEIPPHIAKTLSIRLQGRIFEDKNNEQFYEETTSVVYKPNPIISKSSATLMNFEMEELGIDKTTSMHYHPGERSLHIITTSKRAGVTLNFCGVAENPDDRKDCEVELLFPPNSMIILNFPPFTHHKFHGEFVCNSVHPREGENFIEAVQSGRVPEGFLASATVFSGTDSNQSKWQISLPESGVLKGNFRY